MRTEEITNALGRRQIPMVERGQFSKVLTELHLESGPAFDPAAAQKFGRQVGAQAVLIGTLVPRGVRRRPEPPPDRDPNRAILDSPTIINVPRGGSPAADVAGPLARGGVGLEAFLAGGQGRHLHGHAGWQL